VSSSTSTPPPKAERGGDETGPESTGGGRGKHLAVVLGSFFTTLPGLLTGIAALGTAFFGGTQLSSQPGPAATPTVTVTATVTATAPAEPAVSGSAVSPGPSSAEVAQGGPAASVPPAPAGAELSALTSLQSSTVDQLTTDQAQQVGAKTYANAVRFSCSDRASGTWAYNELNYEVAGSTAFDATFGVPDNASNGTGNSATITFFRDGGSTRMANAFTVALDAPVHVHLSLQGTSQLEIDCSAADQNSSNGDDIDVAIVNGTLSK
jgi:hypothetical protein